MALPTSPIKSSKNAKSGVSSPAALFLILLTLVVYLNRGMDARVSTGGRSRSSKYIPSRLERKVMKVSRSALGYDKNGAKGCNVFWNKSDTELYGDYHQYMAKLDNFGHATSRFRVDEDVEDIRLLSDAKRKKICKKMDKLLHDNFNAKADLSLTNVGHVEPLLPPMRHPRYCEKGGPYLLNIEYLVHDFGFMCRQMKSGTRTAFFDLGASLQFHVGNSNPALNLVALFRRFGIQFDHYYAFEYTVIPPKKVYEKIPEELLPAYHWYNVPVESSPASKQNPWTSLLSKFKPEDLVIIKLDIDTSSIEIPLFQELAQDKYARLVDHVYFEHHVTMLPLLKLWKDHGTVNGTLQESLDMFTSLRERGIGAHSWV